MAEQLHHQPAGVAAGAPSQPECFLGRLYAGLHADGVGNVMLQAPIHADQEVDGALRRKVDVVEVGLKQGCDLLRDQVGRQFPHHGGLVLKRELFGIWLKKEIKRIEHHHVNHHVHRDLEFTRRLGKNQSGLVVGERVLLPVDEVLDRLDPERIRQHLGAAVRGRAQAHDLRAQRDQPVVGVMGDVVQGNVDGQDSLTFVNYCLC